MVGVHVVHCWVMKLVAFLFIMCVGVPTNQINMCRGRVCGGNMIGG